MIMSKYLPTTAIALSIALTGATPLYAGGGEASLDEDDIFSEPTRTMVAPSAVSMTPPTSADANRELEMLRLQLKLEETKARTAEARARAAEAEAETERLRTTSSTTPKPYSEMTRAEILEARRVRKERKEAKAERERLRTTASTTPKPYSEMTRAEILEARRVRKERKEAKAERERLKAAAPAQTDSEAFEQLRKKVARPVEQAGRDIAQLFKDIF